MNYHRFSDFDTIYAVLGGGIIVLSLLVIALIVIFIVANWKMFKKAGKNGWECIVPFYSFWVLVEISGLNWWRFLLLIADSIVSIFDIDSLSEIANLVSLFASFNCYYNIAKKFNRSTGASVCAGIFSFIFILIFGFSKNVVYNVNIPVSKNSVFGSPDANNNISQSTNTVDTSNKTEDNFNQENSFCDNCGTKLNKDGRFCPNCGREIL